MLPANTHILFPEFDLHSPTSIAGAVELLSTYGENARVMAGGTDLLVQMKMERRQPSQVVSLRRIPELRAITDNGQLTIGSTASIRAIAQSPISNRLSCLREACNAFSTVQIMYMATLGGNLCNASPAADSAACLLALDATVTLKSQTRERTLPLTDFFVGPGRTIIQPDELLTYIHIPHPAQTSGSAFLKMSRVVADISQVCAAASLVRYDDKVAQAHIALGSVAPTPLRLTAAAQVLVNESFTPELAQRAGEVAAGEIRPISDVRASREYRRQVAAVLVRDALLKAWERTF